MKYIVRQIKWAWQRATRGYDDTIFFGFDGYFEYAFVPPLKRFCEQELKAEYAGLNPKRMEVFQHTLKLIEALDDEEYLDSFNSTAITVLATYFGQHIGYYWD